MMEDVIKIKKEDSTSLAFPNLTDMLQTEDYISSAVTPDPSETDEEEEEGDDGDFVTPLKKRKRDENKSSICSFARSSNIPTSNYLIPDSLSALSDNEESTKEYHVQMFPTKEEIEEQSQTNEVIETPITQHDEAMLKMELYMILINDAYPDDYRKMNDGVQFIVDTMKNYKLIEEIQEAGCKAIAELGLNSLFTCLLIEIEIEDVIIHSMNCFDRNNIIQRAGSETITKMAHIRDLIPRLRISGAIKSIMNAICCFPDQEKIQQNGCETLSILMNTEAMMPISILNESAPLVLSAMMSFPHNSVIKVYGCKMLDIICERCDNAVELIRMGAIEAISNITLDFNLDVLNILCSTLSKLLSDDQSLMEAGMRDSLKTINMMEDCVGCHSIVPVKKYLIGFFQMLADRILKFTSAIQPANASLIQEYSKSTSSSVQVSNKAYINQGISTIDLEKALLSIKPLEEMIAEKEAELKSFTNVERINERVTKIKGLWKSLNNDKNHDGDDRSTSDKGRMDFRSEFLKYEKEMQEKEFAKVENEFNAVFNLGVPQRYNNRSGDEYDILCVANKIAGLDQVIVANAKVIDNKWDKDGVRGYLQKLNESIHNLNRDIEELERKYKQLMSLNLA